MLLWWVGAHRLEPLPLQVRHSALHAAANRGGLNGTRVCRCLVSTAGVATCVQCVAKDEPVSVQDLIDSVSSAAATVDTTVDYSAVLNSMLKAQTHEDAVAALPETPEDYTVPRKLVTIPAQCCTDPVVLCFGGNPRRAPHEPGPWVLMFTVLWLGLCTPFASTPTTTGMLCALL